LLARNSLERISSNLTKVRELEERIIKSSDHPIIPSGTESGSAKATAFQHVAPYYDHLMSTVPYQMWVGYYLLLLSYQDVHPKTMLDVCCGTGNMCELLHAEGFELAGVDLSASMIREAKRKAAEYFLPIEYECMDASTFELNRTFDAAFSFYDSLNNITDPARLQMAFHRVAAHLKPGGSFIFDLNTAYAFEQHMFDQQNLKPGAELRYKWVGDWDPTTRIISVQMKFWHEGKEFDEVHVQRAYELDEIREMLENAGFQDIHSYNSYTLDPVRKRSDRIHFTAIRT
jgi:ubiquinone/menaquinone biosynthesis C-methylase UbiE